MESWEKPLADHRWIFPYTRRVTIFAFAGFARSGKSTAAQFLYNLLEEQGRPVGIWSFASPIKELCQRLFEDAEREKVRDLGMAAREIDNDCWVRLLQAELNEVWKILGEDLYVIIDDVRMQNEVDWIRQCGGQLFFVHRPHNPFLSLRDHGTEKLAAKWEKDLPKDVLAIINPGKSISEYHDAVEACLKQVI